MSREAAKAAYDKMRQAVEAQRAFLESIKGREPSAEDRAKIASMDADIDTREADVRFELERVERSEAADALDKRMAAFAGTAAPAVVDEDPYAAKMRGLIDGSVRVVDFDFAKREYLTPRAMEKRVATSGSATNAGDTSRLTFVAQVIESMRWRSQFLSQATILNTPGGETLTWPVKTARPTATWVAENTQISTSDETWSNTTLGAYKLAVIVQASREIVADSALDILSILAEDAGIAVADGLMTRMLTGTGSGQLHGYVTRASGTVNAANLAGVTFDNVIDLEHSLLLPYRKTAQFMCHDTTVAALRKIKDAQGRYLWEPSVQLGAPSTLHGIPVNTDPNLATAGSAAKVLVYGDPARYLLRQAHGIQVTRSDEYGFDKDLVSFKVTWRGDGDVLDTAAVKALTVTA